MPCKCILYPLPQIIFLFACNRLHALTGFGRLLSVFILASRELPSIWDLSKMESRSTGMASPTPAVHWATMAFHSEAKSCALGKGCKSGSSSAAHLSLEPQGQAGMREHFPHAVQYLRDACICWLCSPALVHPGPMVQSRLWANPPPGCTTRHHPSMHPVLPQGCSNSIATNAAFLKEL